MNTLKKQSTVFLLAMICSLLLLSFFNVTAKATTGNTSELNNGVTLITNVDNEIITDKDISGDSQVPNISVESAKDLIERKTYDVVEILQVFGKPFSAIMFIVCAFVTLFGTVTKSGSVGKGVLGMFIAGMVYTAVLYAPELVHFFSTWLTT